MTLFMAVQFLLLLTMYSRVNKKVRGQEELGRGGSGRRGEDGDEFPHGEGTACLMS